MYQIGKFAVDGTVKSVPAVWVVKVKGRVKCCWPLRDVKTKIKKRTPPPSVTNSKYWSLLDIELQLNGKMFGTLELAESNVEKILVALKESENVSLNNLSENTSASQCSSVDEKPAENERSLVKKKLPSTKNSLACEKFSANTNFSVTGNIQKSKIVSVIKTKPIESVAQYEAHELFLSKEVNMQLYVDKWIQKPHNNENEFIKLMIGDTFDPAFFNKEMSFEKRKGKISLIDSNIVRCWIYIIGKKFGEKIIFDKIVTSFTENVESSQGANGSANGTDAGAKKTCDANPILKLAVPENSVVPQNSFEINKHFPICNPDNYDAVEVFFLKEENIEITANIWNNICQNKVQLFIEHMILKTFTQDFFLYDTTFKKGERKVVTKGGQKKGKIEEGELKKLLDGSNIFKCWQVALTKKFPLLNVSEAEITKYYRTLKNTLGRSK